MKRFYAPPENFDGQIVTLSLEESKHLRNALRMREGAEVFVFDGEGNEFRCKIEKIEREKDETVLRILEGFSEVKSESNLNLTLAVALLKGEKFDLVVQKACELGVSRIVPVRTKRADVKLDNAKDIQKRLERWQKIALEAAKQSRRAKLMQIETPISFEDFVENSKGTRILFAERGGESFESFKGSSSKISEINAVVGSEGGWESLEIELARAKGFRVITLGGRILRAETAAIVAAVLLQNHFGDLR